MLYRPVFDTETYAQGGSGVDDLRGGDGFDALRGEGGDDILSGGAGADVAYLGGALADYSWSRVADGAWVVRDLRPGSPDGADRLYDVEILAFADDLAWIGPQLPSVVETAFRNVLRLGSAAPQAALDTVGVGSNIAIGKTAEAAAQEIGIHAGDTTSVATLNYQFFTGRTPSEAGLDFLVSPTGANPTNLNSAYFQGFNFENRYINFAVNLGARGEGAARFQAEYGGLSLSEAARKAYTTIFGAAPTEAKLQALVGARADYFAFYGQDGPNGTAAKAAMVGWLLAEAVKTNLGVYARANGDYLKDLADGAPFAVDLVGSYGRPEYAYFG